MRWTMVVLLFHPGVFVHPGISIRFHLAKYLRSNLIAVAFFTAVLTFRKAKDVECFPHGGMIKKAQRRGSEVKTEVKTCPYCGSNVERMNQQQYYCEFCCMSLDARLVKENRERLDVRVREFALEVYIEKTTPELMTFSTFELLYLLSMIRKERNDMYSQMNTFYKAGLKGETDEFKAYEKITGKDYVFYEKVICGGKYHTFRLGYVPSRITESYLVKYLENIKNDKNGPMMIRTERQ